MKTTKVVTLEGKEYEGVLWTNALDRTGGYLVMTTNKNTDYPHRFWKAELKSAVTYGVMVRANVIEDVDLLKAANGPTILVDSWEPLDLSPVPEL